MHNGKCARLSLKYLIRKENFPYKNYDQEEVFKLLSKSKIAFSKEKIS